jgi:hypothetical protein
MQDRTRVAPVSLAPQWATARGEVHVGDTQQEEARKRQKIQEQLDEALADSFPASDPVSIVTSHEEEDWGTEPLAPESKKPRC